MVKVIKFYLPINFAPNSICIHFYVSTKFRLFIAMPLKQDNFFYFQECWCLKFESVNSSCKPMRTHKLTKQVKPSRGHRSTIKIIHSFSSRDRKLLQ